jgi:hypothetical protein
LILGGGFAPSQTNHERIRSALGGRGRRRFSESNTVPSFRQSGGGLELTVPSIEAHEVIAVDLGA